jgi:hypothetical protein
MDGHQGDGDEDEHDQEGQIDDWQDVGEGDTVSAHGFEISGVWLDSQLKSADVSGLQ